MGGDNLLDVAVQATAVAEPHFQPAEPALPLRYARVRTEAVFEQQEPAARFEHAVDFRHRLFKLFDHDAGKDPMLLR